MPPTQPAAAITPTVDLSPENLLSQPVAISRWTVRLTHPELPRGEDATWLIKRGPFIAAPSKVWGCFPALQQLPGLAPPDSHWQIFRAQPAGQTGVLLGRCSVWWQDLPEFQGQRVGFIGHYQALNAAVAGQLLRHACQDLRTQGCTLALAPVDGSTWATYRTQSRSPVRGAVGAVPFFLEPHYSSADYDQLAQQQFQPIITYHSQLARGLTYRDPRLQAARQRLHAAGITMSTPNLQKFGYELERLHPLVMQRFQHQPLFQEIELASFSEIYNQLRPHLQPELMIIAEQQQQIVGFILAVPDYRTLSDSAQPRRIVVKTLVTKPQREYRGLGSVLLEECHEAAHRLGYQQAIHALMHDQNRSLNLSRRYAAHYRSYAVLGRSLV